MERSKRRSFGDLTFGLYSTSKKLTFTDMAFGKSVYSREPYKLIIEDDSRRYHKDKINFIINYFKQNNLGNLVGIEFKNISIEFYKDLLNTRFYEMFKKVYVESIRDPKKHLNDVAFSINSPIQINQDIIELKDITRIDRNLVDYVHFSKDACFDSNIMSNKEFVQGLDYIAKQINDNASNDLEKILLIDKMLRENTSYDTDYYYKQRPYLSLGEQANHKCHKVQTVLKEKVAVCNAFSEFVMILLNHSLINIECKTVCGASYGEGHMWNEIKLDGKWYSFDFTHSVWFDKEKGTKYSMVKRPSEKHAKDRGNFDNLSELPRSLIESTQEKLENVHIRMSRRKFSFVDEKPDDKKQESVSIWKFYPRHKR